MLRFAGQGNTPSIYFRPMRAADHSGDYWTPCWPDGKLLEPTSARIVLESVGTSPDTDRWYDPPKHPGIHIGETIENSIFDMAFSQKATLVFLALSPLTDPGQSEQGDSAE